MAIAAAEGLLNRLSSNTRAPEATRALPPAYITDGVGLALLSHFGPIIDYSHNRLLAIPNVGAANAPFIKDRLGLVVTRQGDKLAVAFVSPGSPAEAAGFKKGDGIVALNGKPAAACLRSVRHHTALQRLRNSLHRRDEG
jgi:predicted metalloprotease with PDZ domain